MINNLMTEINDVKTINFDLLEEQYGIEVSQRIKERFEYCLEQKHGEWSLNIIEENKYFVAIAFVTSAYSWVYRVNMSLMNISDQYIIGKVECKSLLGLMNSLCESSMV